MATKTDETKVKLGEYGYGGEGNPPLDFTVDVPALIDTRLLINAASGGGKSYLLRRIIELLAIRLQVIVIDPEGEFSSLREKFDMLLVGKGGEIEPEIRTARALARKLAELRVSAIIDLYDLGDWDMRRAYVAPFLDGLMTLPKAQYHPMLVAIDEAHYFAPEGDAGKAGSATSESRRAMRTMSSTGRKRAICLAMATQRISKMDKDTIADAKNIVIGGQTLDIDMRRSGDILGMDREGRLSLRDLQPGEFWAFGPALPRGVNNFFVDKVITTHPKAGQRHMLEVPPASGAIKAIVASLADLPQKAVEDANELEAARAEVKRLRAENAEARAELGGWMAEATRQPAEPVEVRVPILAADDLKALEVSVERAAQAAADLLEGKDHLAGLMSHLDTLTTDYQRGRDDLAKALEKARALLAAPASSNGHGAAPNVVAVKGERVMIGGARPAGLYAGGSLRPADTTPKTIAKWEGVKADAGAMGASGASLNKAARAVLTVLAQRGPRTKRQIAIQTGYAIKGGAFIQTLKSLADLGYTDKAGEALEITNLGRKALGSYDDLPTGRALRDYWMGHSALTQMARAALAVLLEYYPEAYTAEILAEYAARKAGRSEPYAHKGGAFIDALKTLRGLGLVERSGSLLKASAELFG